MARPSSLTAQACLILSVLLVSLTAALGQAAPADKANANAAPAPTLLQFNDALQQLAAKVSAGVVQVLVNGYGAVEGSSGKGEAALIARQRAIGSGVVVDPEGYIMTNAHVVEGAQRIRIVIPIAYAPGQGPIVETEGKLRVLDAKLVGVHKESDLAS